ncbi:MAG: hypothetical protein V1709_09995 [Planctomycetota bacterium]
MTKTVPDPNCLQEINRKLDRLTELFEGFLTGFKGSAPALSAVRAPKFPLPPATNWSDIVIKLTGTYALISVRDKMPKPRKVNFVELDCYDKLRKSRLNPDRHWHLLQRLAEHDGELPWHKAGRIKHRWSADGDEDDSESTEMIGKSSIIHTDKYSAKEISRTKKTIYGLRQKLKTFFGLAEDPFYPYSEAHTYKTKFQLKTYNPDEWKNSMEDLSDEEESDLPPIP